MGNANAAMRIDHHHHHHHHHGGAPRSSSDETTAHGHDGLEPPSCSPMNQSIQDPAAAAEAPSNDKSCVMASSSSSSSSPAPPPPKPKPNSNGRLCVHVTNAGVAHGTMPSATSPLYSSSTSNNANVVSRYQQISGQMIAAATSKPGAGIGSGGVTVINGINTSHGAPSSYHESSPPSNILPTGQPDRATHSPLISTEQHPQVPAYSEVLGKSHVYVSEKTSQAPENTIATLIEWKYGGSNVCVEGSWDDWGSRIPLQKSGKVFTIVKILPEGVYHYRFVVDGELRHAPDLPYIFDSKGKAMNVLDVQDYVPESLEGLAEFEAPPSPESSYDNYLPGAEDYSKDPPLLPSQLHLNTELESLHQFPNSSLNASTAASPRPDHVILNHLFLETRKQARSPVLTLGFTHRFRSKYITVILHKPLRR